MRIIILFLIVRYVVYIYIYFNIILIIKFFISNNNINSLFVLII